MKKRFSYGLMGLPVLMLIGCGTIPLEPTADMPQSTFNKSTKEVQKAAVDATAIIGCDVEKDQPTYIECRRPRKVGLFAGSGGETVSIYLEEQGPKKTLIHVNTATTFFGGMGQKDWSAEIIQEMQKRLGQSK